MIVDCHTHVAPQLTGFWRPLRRGKVEDEGRVRQAMPPSFDPPASPPEVLLGYMDQAGVDRAFIVQHHLYGDHNPAVLEAIKSWPDRFVGFAYLGGLGWPDAPDQLARLVEGGMAGLKVELGTTRRLCPGFRFDGERERPLVLDVNEASSDDVAALRRLVDEFQRIRFVICHVGWPARDGWQERALLAKHPRGWVDLASLPGIYGPEQEYPFPRSQELVRWAVETFGAERVMWGTDYPGTLNDATYRQHVDFIRRHCAFLTPEQKLQVLGGAADSLLRDVG